MWKDNISQAILLFIRIVSPSVKDWLKPRTVFAALFYFTLCRLILNNSPIPEILKEIVSFMMGFYFGKKLPDQVKKEE